MGVPGDTRTRAVDDHLILSDAVRDEIERMRAAGELGDGYRTVQSCYVCCEVESRDLVNKLIAAGLTNREIAEACGAINMRRADAGDERIIKARNIWVHKTQHFNIDKPAQAVLREIAERRATEQNRDFINGIAHIVTPYAVLESAMAKGFAEITDENTEIGVRNTILAATKLDELTNRDASQRKVADLMWQVDRIITAIREVVPEEYHQAILDRVDGRVAPTPVTAIAEHVTETAEAAIREFTPQAKVDERDAL
jgi:hypothetical protein